MRVRNKNIKIQATMIHTIVVVETHVWSELPGSPGENRDVT